MILVVGIGGWGTTRVSASHQTMVGSFLSHLPADATLLMHSHGTHNRQRSISWLDATGSTGGMSKGAQ
jgi:hypothetical protein